MCDDVTEVAVVKLAVTDACSATEPVTIWPPLVNTILPVVDSARSTPTLSSSKVLIFSGISKLSLLS